MAALSQSFDMESFDGADEELPHIDEDAVFTFSQACAAGGALDQEESRDYDITHMSRCALEGPVADVLANRLLYE